ncbi:PucC family protein [Thalassococcus sp. S3]|uniref:PucC family protein n=1 Tax=Thalassococcus sp. S3 TaxID=2017482 RepID=UPI0010242C56|nr:PucC family protein [Thalassococcus sp. S3]QBF30254.1 MFS transporter [Thalassococcus sp. S3]
MFDYRAFALRKLASIGPRYLPFADVATDDVPLSRLLRLSLFQITVGMAIVLLVGTLNRVMIVELGVPATLVAVMLALPLVFAPFRTLIGHKSDVHVSALGWRRVPFIWKGTLYQFGGFAVMPFSLLVLSGYGEAVDAPRWIGLSSAAIAFLLVGAGVHMVQTVGLALATDLVEDEDQPKVVGLMYVMLLVGMVVSALVFGTLLENYTPGRLIQVIQGAAVVTVALNLLAMWKQEARDRVRAQQMAKAEQPPFRDALAKLVRLPGKKRLLIVIALGTFGFGAADVLLEPYGGEVLGLSVADTTKLTALLAGGTLIGFAIASRVLGRGGSPTRLGLLGAFIGIPGFGAIILSSLGGGSVAFLCGTVMTGLGAGLFGHATLTATMRSAPRAQIGLALGTWGAVQATAAGVGVALAGIVRDVIHGATLSGTIPAHAPYNAVFLIEIVFLLLACAIFLPMAFNARRASSRETETAKRSRSDRHSNPAEAS